MRIVVTISKETMPELYLELEAIPPRHRADRLRNLAFLGLALINGKVSGQCDAQKANSKTGSKISGLAKLKKSIKR